MAADALCSLGNVASFRMQVSRTTRKVWPRASQGPRPSLGFDERNSLAFTHALAPILAVCFGQSRGELEPNDLAFDNGCRVHDTSVRKECKPHKLETTTFSKEHSGVRGTGSCGFTLLDAEDDEQPIHSLRSLIVRERSGASRP